MNYKGKSKMNEKTKGKERKWPVNLIVTLKAVPGNIRAKNRLYEHGNKFRLVEVDGDNIHVYSLDGKWFGWFGVGREVRPATSKDSTIIKMGEKVK